MKNVVLSYIIGSMKRVKLGRTGITVSHLGIGSGTAHPSGHCAQALMSRREFADLLLFAYERGINFWDTAIKYGTHPHVKEALKGVKRSDIVITTKLITFGKRDTTKDFHTSLRELGVDYLDVCLMHGVRTEGELKRRTGALDTLLEFKRQGKVRAVGLSSHGLSALKAVIKNEELDVVWARINFAGLCVDSCRLGLYEQLASVAWVKKTAETFVPKRVLSAVRSEIESWPVSMDKLNEVQETLGQIHAQSKGVVGMKVIAEGKLREDPQKAVKYVASLPFVDSFIIGMMNRDEIDENCRVVNGMS
jgi:aryl-alcohol dehydrogenase-like predicted oxidoreductase